MRKLKTEWLIPAFLLLPFVSPFDLPAERQNSVSQHYGQEYSSEGGRGLVLPGRGGPRSSWNSGSTSGMGVVFVFIECLVCPASDTGPAPGSGSLCSITQPELGRCARAGRKLSLQLPQAGFPCAVPVAPAESAALGHRAGICALLFEKLV